jgi:hypothetical protein
LQQLRQLGDVGGDASRFVAREQTGSRPSARFIFEIDVGERLPSSDDFEIGSSDFPFAPFTTCVPRAGSRRSKDAARIKGATEKWQTLMTGLPKHDLGV